MEEYLKIMWAIELIIILIIIIVLIKSNREIDTQESIRRNIKIGMARTLGAMIIIFTTSLILETTIYFIKEYQKEKEINCKEWKYINGIKKCTKSKN